MSNNFKNNKNIINKLIIEDKQKNSYNWEEM